jgi:hypothetical protein
MLNFNLVKDVDEKTGKKANKKVLKSTPSDQKEFLNINPYSIPRPFWSTAVCFFNTQLRRRTRMAYFSKDSETLVSSTQDQFRKQLRQGFDEKGFTQLGENFKKDGLLILEQYFKQQVDDMKAYYQAQLNKRGKYNKMVGIKMFTGAVNEGVDLNEAMSCCLADPLLLSLLSDCCGEPVVLADFRGYTSEPHAPLSFRAWGWHNDGVIAAKKAPEIKVMILLNDVNPGGQEMFYIKQSVRPWLVGYQRDANFLPEEIPHVLKDHDFRITRCCGKAGSIIIFNGEGIHCATRGMQPREVLVFTFRPNNNDPAIYPIPPIAPAVGEKIKGTFLATALGQDKKTENPAQQILSQIPLWKKIMQSKLLEIKEASSTHTASKEETYRLLQAHKKFPTINNIKPRIGRSNLNKEELLTTIIRVDLHADLDLRAHSDNRDVRRDVLRIQYRETNDNDPKISRLKQRYKGVGCNLADIRVIPDFQKYAQEFVEFLEKWAVVNKTDVDAKSTASTNLQLRGNFKDRSCERYRAACQLGLDLKEAFSHCEYVQELRTNILFLYFLYDEAGEAFNEQSIKLKALELLQAYTAIVNLDDSYYCLLSEEEVQRSVVQYRR